VTFSASITVDAPAERVWAVMSDVERWPEWTASITSVQRLEAGPLRIGARARIVQPKLRPMVWTVTALVPNHSFTWVMSAAGTTGTADHRIEPAQGGVSVTLSIRNTGLLAPLVNLLYGGLTRRYLDMECRGLKRRCETANLVSAA
jgi:uncharacterized membrane protein